MRARKTKQKQIRTPQTQTKTNNIVCVKIKIKMLIKQIKNKIKFNSPNFQDFCVILISLPVTNS